MFNFLCLDWNSQANPLLSINRRNHWRADSRVASFSSRAHLSFIVSFRSSSRHQTVSALMTCRNHFLFEVSSSRRRSLHCDILKRQIIKFKRRENCVKLVRSTHKSAIEMSKRLRNEKSSAEMRKSRNKSQETIFNWRESFDFFSCFEGFEDSRRA